MMTRIHNTPKQSTHTNDHTPYVTKVDGEIITIRIRPPFAV